MDSYLRSIAWGAALWCSLGILVADTLAQEQKPASREVTGGGPKVRIAAVQTKRRTIDYQIKPAVALEQVDKILGELEQLVHQAGKSKCDAIAFPEDTLGLLNWTGANELEAKEVLPVAVKRMLQRLGAAAASHHMYLVVCSDNLEPDGGIYNTSFLLSRDGKEIGRYHKVCPTWSEAGLRRRGSSLPVFATPDLGTVGMLICYDLVFPETSRCLALQGADVIFFPTMGAAAMGDGDIGEQALRVRAVENFVWLVVAFRSGSMIISPQGKIVARSDGPDTMAIADIDVAGNREGGDAMNWQRDMRARLFRERNPAAFGMLTEPKPPVLDKVPIDLTAEQAGRIMARVLTIGEDQFRAANSLVAAGKMEEAIEAFERLRTEFPGSWIDRRSQERLEQLQQQKKAEPKRKQKCDETATSETCPVETFPVQEQPVDKTGVAAKYPGDAGIEADPRVVFAENFEEDSLDAMCSRWETVGGRESMSFTDDAPAQSSGKHSLLMDRQQGSGAQLYRRLKNKAGGWGYDQLYARYYVKFAPDCGELHHGVSAIGGYHPATAWPMVKAGIRPAGNKTFWSGIEPFGKSWVWDYYTYWCEMRGSPPRGQTWGNVFIRDPQVTVETGKWICVEHMLKVNDVGDTNGEQALWIDGKLISHLGKGFPKGLWIFDKFNPGQGGPGTRWNDAKGDREYFEVPAGGIPFEGFRWRTSPDVNLNYIWLYIYTEKPAGHRMQVWFDDLVVAREYIGPMQKPQ